MSIGDLATGQQIHGITLAVMGKADPSRHRRGNSTLGRVTVRRDADPKLAMEITF